MNISKFSRSIVVVIFVAFIISSCILDFSMLVSSSKGQYTGIIKLIYAILIFILVAGYIYLKDKLYKLNIGRKISLIYRYIYLILISIISVIVTKLSIFKIFTTLECVMTITFCILISFIVKRIVFNVSKSDMLSVFGMIMSLLIINITIDKIVFFYSLAITFTTVISILVLQVLIDELKQRGMKTKKYIFQSLLLGILIGANIFVGVKYVIWIAIFVSMLFVTINLDNTHINFPRKLMSSLTQEKRENLYKIERINISKLLVSIIVILLVAICMLNILNSVINSNNYENILITSNVVFDDVGGNFGITFMEYLKIFINISKTYYMVIFVYILILEFLAFLLNRKYDTKSTIIKFLLLGIFASISYFKLNILIYQPILTVLLIIIAIVNTSNLYLNREERIKLLVA